MSKKTFIHAENNNKILSSNEVKLYVPPEPEKMKIIIWGKELCNIAEWNDFLKCVEEKTRENDQRIAELEQELAELKEKAIDRPKFKHFEEYWYIENNPYCDNELQVFNGKIMEIICAYDEDWLYEYRFDTSCRYIEEDNIFATEQEAQVKLKEMKGNE